MKTLWLLRHAKSSWDHEGLTDHDRPLNRRGERAAERMAAHLEARGIHPDLVLCSSARRTRDTLERLRPGLPPEIPVRIERDLYGAAAEEILERLRQLPQEVGAPLVIGHNPGLEDLARALADDGPEAARERLRRGLPTAALVEISLDAGRWLALRPGAGRLVSLVRPKDLD